MGQHKAAYQMYTASGKKIHFAKLLKKVQDADVIMFGEKHNNAIAHWLQLELATELSEKRTLILGAEMFEADNQPELTAYVKGEMDAKTFAEKARLWPNYSTDYAPLVDLAKEKGLVFVASNVPRKYARSVYSSGFDALEELSTEEKQWIAPLPIQYDSELPGYKDMMTMAHGHGGDNLPKAQAIKDATMAHFLLKNHQPGSLSLHFNGSYHSQNREGIVWYLQQQQPDLKIVTITTEEQDDISQLETDNKNKADYIIVVDKRVTHTY
ncbi:MAG: ChaN family lipoprotein [Bacteroidota bacterium]